MESCELIGAGSLLQDVVDSEGNNNPYIWGTGFIEEGDKKISGERFRITGVRGKLSSMRVTDCSAPLFFGDPGLLASRAVTQAVKRYKIGIVPHYVDSTNEMVGFIQSLAKHVDDIVIIDATADCEKVVKQISSCEAILSSSLHGLIVADSYKIPNAHLILSSSVRGGAYKFLDYLSVFPDREYKPVSVDCIKKCGNVDELLSLVRGSYTPPKNLRTIQQSIINGFPF